MTIKKRAITEAAMKYAANQPKNNLDMQRAFSAGAKWMMEQLKVPSEAFRIMYKLPDGRAFLYEELFLDKEAAAGYAPMFMSNMIRAHDLTASDEDRLIVMPVKLV